MAYEAGFLWKYRFDVVLVSGNMPASIKGARHPLQDRGRQPLAVPTMAIVGGR